MKEGRENDSINGLPERASDDRRSRQKLCAVCRSRQNRGLMSSMFTIISPPAAYNAIQNGCPIVDARPDSALKPPLYGALSLEDAECLTSCVLFGADPRATVTSALATKVTSTVKSLAGRITVLPHTNVAEFDSLFPFVTIPPPGLPPSLPHCVGRNVFLGSVHHAADTSVLSALRVTGVVNLIGGSFGDSSADTARAHGLAICRFDWDDNERFCILRELTSAAAAIESMRRSSESARVLVHCVAGVSRSPSAVAAWLMWHDPEARANTAGEALALLRTARVVVRVNDGFAFQLGQFEEALVKAGGRGAPREAIEEHIERILSR